jgi:ADP-ribose pyrophosphatase YjhB (NUDIX family)
MQIPADSIYVSGPVIIENNKVVLVKEKHENSNSLWAFPGGGVEGKDADLEAACRREVMEELGIEIEIIKPLLTITDKSWSHPEKKFIMYHFLAKRIGEIKLGDDMAEYGWFDINNLPDDCAPNVYKIISDFKNMS